MEYIHASIDFILHIDKHLHEFTDNYGTLTYILLFIIIFCETGLVVCPFLPGDSLMFAAGALAGAGLLNPILLFVIMFLAAVSGDTANYHVGKKFGHVIIRKKFIKQKHLDKTHDFFEKHGGKTIVYARFVPIVRTLAPFVAGISKMSYKYFIHYNFFGGLIWTALFTALGYFFGTRSFVKNNFSMVILAIIFISLLPPIISYIIEKLKKKSDKN
jgi:membrane-associated protein